MFTSNANFERMLPRFSTDHSVSPENLSQNPLTLASVPRGCRRGQLEANSDRAATDADVWLAGGETPKLGMAGQAAGFGGGFRGYASITQRIHKQKSFAMDYLIMAIGK